MSASSPLSIKLVPALPSDAAAIADLAIAAFSEDHLQRLPLPPSVPRRDPASWRKKLVESLAKAASDEGKKEGHELVKAVGALEGKDGRQEDILGFGLWMWVDKARPAEGLVEDDFRSELMSTDPWLDAMFGRARSGSEGGDAGSDAAGLVEETTTPWEAMAAQTNKVYQQWGIPHKRIYYLALLCVSPSAQGRGIGGALLSRGHRRADKAGRTSVLLATPAGYPLYKALGWNAIGEGRVDLARWGGEGKGWGEYAMRVCMRLPEADEEDKKE